MPHALAIRGGTAGADSSGRPQQAGPTPVLPTLWLARIALTAFRSYARLDQTLDRRPVVLTGANGAGKTNLLEALSLLAPGRGLRRARLGEMARLDAAEPWAVAADLMTPEGLRQVGTGRDPEQPATATERRVVRLDGRNERSQARLAELLDVVWLTPQMDGLWRDGSSERRRFLDRLVYGFDPAHAGRVQGYETALRERARLLTERRGDPAWLAALEGEMAERAVAIAAARRDLVGRLAAACATAEGPFPRAGLALMGDAESWLAEGSALEVEDRLKAAWREARGRDAETGGAALGPHRSDLRATHLAKAMPAELCSTGEQKALLVSVVLAHARLVQLARGRSGLLLLDEVAAHLDGERRAALYESLLALGAQAWLTGTEGELFAALGSRAQHFLVADGALRRLGQ